MKYVIFTGVAVAVFCAGLHAQTSYTRDLPAALVKQAKITEPSASAIARKRVPTGTIRAVELEQESGKLIYSYEMTIPGKSGSEEVNVDAVTGRVIGVHHESAATERQEAAAEAGKFRVQKFDIKGDGGTDYVTSDPATGRVFVSRSTHMMVVDGKAGRVIGDIPNTPGVHGAGLAAKAGHGFTTNGGNSTVTMFDLKTLAVIRQIPVAQGGLDGIMYDAADDRIILTNHSRPVGTLTALDPKTGDIVGTANLESTSPEGAAADGKGHIFVNNEGASTIQVIDVRTWKATASWPLAPCEGPTGIAYDPATNRVFSGCSRTSVVLDASTGKVVATIPNGTRVDALGWDPQQKLIYVPNGGEGNVTVVRQDSPDKYTVVATVPTFAGAKTITVDPRTHNAYLFQPERGPAPAPAPGAAPPPAGPGGRGRGPLGPVVAGWFIVISQ